MLTSGPRKELSERENGLRSNFPVTIAYQFEPGKFIDLLGVSVSQSAYSCHTLCRRTMNEV